MEDTIGIGSLKGDPGFAHGTFGFLYFLKTSYPFLFDLFEE